MNLQEIKKRLSKRKKDSHKGQNGEVLIIGGSEDYIGCLALAGLSALRTGVDWVTVAAPEKVGWALSSLTPDLVVKKYKCGHFCAAMAKNLLKLSEKFDAVLIGNGIGLHAKTFCRAFLKSVKIPCVIDADAIKSISLNQVDNCILTPHKRELETLLKNSNLNPSEKEKRVLENFYKTRKIKKELIKLLQSRVKNNILVVKSSTDYIISKNRIAANKTGNPGMTVGGTGDVLAGLCVGFLAQTKDPFWSAHAAAYLNGKVGDVLKKKQGYTFIASDLVREIEKII